MDLFISWYKLNLKIYQWLNRGKSQDGRLIFEAKDFSRCAIINYLSGETPLG